jgi:hypothetical protein
MMLKRMLEKSFGPLPASTFREILDLATTDIKVNRIGFNRRTSLADAVGIAEICCEVLRR